VFLPCGDADRLEMALEFKKYIKSLSLDRLDVMITPKFLLVPRN
jgi:hypothetical protein